MQDTSENLTSKSVDVIENPQDRVSDALTEKTCGNTRVLYRQKFSIVTMTTNFHRGSEEERISSYVKVE